MSVYHTTCVPGAQRHKEGIGSLKLELQTFVDSCELLLGIKPGPSGRTVSAFNCEPSL